MCHKYLVRAAEDIPIVEMHQPKDWELSGLSMYQQIKLGLERIRTKWVAIAEHDCLYSHEHFSFIPQDDTFFWYNTNCWLVQHTNPNHSHLDGQYSLWPGRRVQSQLICDAKKLREITEVQIAVTGDPKWREIRRNKPIGEPGTVGEKALRLTSGSRYSSLHGRIKDYLIGYKAMDFSTKIPNIDIRHGGNLTGPRRGSKRTYELSPWGRWNDIL